MSAEVTLITKFGIDPLMSKRIFLDEQGALQSDGSQCLMIQGKAERVPAGTAGKLAEIISQCPSHSAIALGALKDGLPSSVSITVPRNLKDHPGAITRSRDHINYQPGLPGWVLIDFDTKGLPREIAGCIKASGGMWNALLRVAPGLSRAARVSRASTSSGLFRSDTGAPIPGSNGTHHYVLLQNGSDADRFLHDLHDRCWLHGSGWHHIGAAGQLLERSLVDRMVGFGERLCFEGAPRILPPLAQDPCKRVPIATDGEAIDSLRVVPRLNEYERHRVAEAKVARAHALARTAAEIRAGHDKKLADKISQKFELPVATALRLVQARHRGVLLPYVELDFDHLGIVPVAKVLADPERFIGETLADPLEGADYGRCKAKVMRDDEGGLFIHSFAHGRAIYKLRHDGRSAKAAIAQMPRDGLIDNAMEFLAQAEMEADELAEFAAALAEAAGIGLRPVKARVAKAQRERKQAEQRAAVTSEGDGRMVRPRPESDGELTPTVTYLDLTLAADEREEPPMRDASGKLVEVRVREPWAMHLLTSDNVNAENAGDEEEAMKPPAEPGLERLSPVRVEMLVERYVVWIVTKKNRQYFAALPPPFVDGLMQFSPSSIPIVRAINTAPLVSMSGEVIAGAGLDRKTGLFHCIDALLQGCIPVTPPTEQDVRAALIFLYDDWLVDVALDPVGKAVAIMLAMTLIERTLLPERPAFFIAAALRSGGKTTLVNMITLAVLGRRASAAAWSYSAEERRKALFSYFRQAVACLVWDNIIRGSAISCPHIEKALTATEISDRVLGGSLFETVSSTTVQIFTGNSITPRGDMASRSMRLALTVDRPDPENRAFVHADPLAWTEANRGKILHALYTLLIAGALNRPSNQEAKTRFKVWWRLVGWPMEYAAALLGTRVDCTESMRAGEAGDEEAAAVTAALSILRKIWDGKKFTAKEVAKAIAPIKNGAPLVPSDSADSAIATAEALADALDELAGKRLDRPTAHRIGKLFQKCLVDRPAWLNDGGVVAVLRNYPGHQENTYTIEVGAAGQNTDYRPNLPRQHSPHSPLSPGRHSGNGSSGKEGKEGKVFAATAADAVNSMDAEEATPGRWSARI
jgi:hypothetical protein